MPDKYFVYDTDVNGVYALKTDKDSKALKTSLPTIGPERYSPIFYIGKASRTETFDFINQNKNFMYILLPYDSDDLNVYHCIFTNHSITPDRSNPVGVMGFIHYKNNWILRYVTSSDDESGGGEFAEISLQNSDSGAFQGYSTVFTRCKVYAIFGDVTPFTKSQSDLMIANYASVYSDEPEQVYIETDEIGQIKVVSSDPNRTYYTKAEVDKLLKNTITYYYGGSDQYYIKLEEINTVKQANNLFDFDYYTKDELELLLSQLLVIKIDENNRIYMEV